MNLDLSASTRAALDATALWLATGVAAFALVACGGGGGGGGTPVAFPTAPSGTAPPVAPAPTGDPVPAAEPPPAGAQKSFHCAPEPKPA